MAVWTNLELVPRFPPTAEACPCAISLLQRLNEVMPPPTCTGIDRILRAGVHPRNLVRFGRHIHEVVIEPIERLLRLEFRAQEIWIVGILNKIGR